MLDQPSNYAPSLQIDPLSEVLQDLRLSGVSYGRCELSRPWGIAFPPQRAARFHFVGHGPCWLREPDDGWTELHAGDVVLVPHGRGHALACAPDHSVAPLEDLPLEPVGDRTFRMRAGGDGAVSVLFCGSIAFEQPAANPLLDLMPSILRVEGAANEDPVLPLLLDTMAKEVAAQRLGAMTVLARLAEVVVARVVRSWAETHATQTAGWLTAIRDPKVGRALVAIHGKPGEAWTLERLAKAAGMSRSVFAERFNSLMGMPPAEYLARWRMQVASGWLRDDGLTVARAADRLGYESEASFSRAFKRLTGVPPSALRRAGRLGLATPAF